MLSLRTVVDPLGLLPRVTRAGKDAASTAADAAARTALGGMERTLASPRAQEAVDLLVRSALAEHTVRAIAEGPLVDAALHTAIRQGLIERVADELLASGAVDHVVDRVLTDSQLDRIVDAVLESPRTTALATHVLDSDDMERLVAQVLDSPGMERLVAQVLDSRLVDASVARVLASDELWLVVDEIARSPAVTEAIGHQGVGFADQVAEEVGRRSRRADARLERVARRLLRRPPAPGTVTGPKQS